jgi:hypothetical protein
MTERFEMRYVQGHVEVYDGAGRFCFSADTVGEARSELRELGSAA